jgi:hypothetical protein
MAGIDLARRRALAGATFAALLSRFASLARAAGEPLMTRPIPRGGERKFILSHAAVTAVIPGAVKPGCMLRYGDSLA